MQVDSSAADPKVSCRQLLLRFLRALDGDASVDVAALVTADAELVHRGDRLVGRDEVVAAFRGRAGSHRTVHVLANDVARLSGPDSVEIDAVLFVHDRDGEGAGPPRTVLDTWQLFIRGPGGWAIRRRETRPYLAE